MYLVFTCVYKCIEHTWAPAIFSSIANQLTLLAFLLIANQLTLLAILLIANTLIFQVRRYATTNPLTLTLKKNILLVKSATVR